MFWFDRAKDYVEKEKDASKSAGATWASLLAALAHLAAAEKAYHNMTFLGQKLGMTEAFQKTRWCCYRGIWKPISATHGKKKLINQNYDISQNNKYLLQISIF